MSGANDAFKGGSNLLEVNTVETVLGNYAKDCLDKGGTVLRGDRRREESGTGPSTDGENRHCVVIMGLLDEIRNVGGSRLIDTKHGRVCSGDAEMETCALRPVSQNERWAEETYAKAQEMRLYFSQLILKVELWTVHPGCQAAATKEV